MKSEIQKSVEAMLSVCDKATNKEVARAAIHFHMWEVLTIDGINNGTLPIPTIATLVNHYQFDPEQDDFKDQIDKVYIKLTGTQQFIKDEMEDYLDHHYYYKQRELEDRWELENQDDDYGDPEEDYDYQEDMTEQEIYDLENSVEDHWHNRLERIAEENEY